MEILTPGQMKVADDANKRITGLRIKILERRHKASEARVLEKFRKKFKIDDLEAAVREAKRALETARDAMHEAEKRMDLAMREEKATLEDQMAEELEQESSRSEQTSLKILAYSLPEDLRKDLLIDQTIALLEPPKESSTKKGKRGRGA